jgi:Mn2+/Fe2+ NRAMP family transporter
MTSAPDPDTLPPDLDPQRDVGVTAPPTRLVGMLQQIGPGLIIAGSIVGSGELIATTKTGAQAGIALLWLITVGCVIKVFVQVELGRYSIVHGQTTLAAINTLPGRTGRVHGILWFWLAMMLFSLGQLGGIVGGVGQSLAITFPITGDYLQAIRIPAHAELAEFVEWEQDRAAGGARLQQLAVAERQQVLRGLESMHERLAPLGALGEEVLARVRAGETIRDPRTRDDRYWAAAVAVITAALLYFSRYGLIQNVSIALVVTFTFITVGNVVSLQMTDVWRISAAEWRAGFSLGFGTGGGGAGLSTALAAFGIIGVGATELVQYPYWCIEKGYARFTGRRTDESDWAARARGWMRVMHVDAFVSMVVYTVATLAFYLMGVAVLHRKGLDPDGMRMVSTLAESYVPVFGAYAKWLFLVGAFAVLYSTFLVALAGHSRLYTDALKVWGLMDPHDQRKHDLCLRTFGVMLPLLCLAIYIAGVNPVTAVLLSGSMQALMLPMLAAAALYFRWQRSDPRIAPRRLWDVMLVLSSIGLLLAGVWGALENLPKLLSLFGRG